MSLAVLVEVLLAALILFGVGAAVTGGFRGLEDVPADDAGDGLPSGPLRPDDLAAARFPLAFRGYRMGDVDAVLDRLAGDLAERDAEIERLTRTAPWAGAGEPVSQPVQRDPEPAVPVTSAFAPLEPPHPGDVPVAAPDAAVTSAFAPLEPPHPGDAPLAAPAVSLEKR